MNFWTSVTRPICLRTEQPRIQNKLLNMEDLTFERACRIAKAIKMAERNMQEVHATNSESPQVNQLTMQDNKNTNHEQCFSCGGNNHSGQSCKFKSAKCHQCSKIDHLASVCCSKSEWKQARSITCVFLNKVIMN